MWAQPYHVCVCRRLCYGRGHFGRGITTHAYLGILGAASRHLHIPAYFLNLTGRGAYGLAGLAGWRGAAKIYLAEDGGFEGSPITKVCNTINYHLPPPTYANMDRFHWYKESYNIWTHLDIVTFGSPDTGPGPRRILTSLSQLAASSGRAGAAPGEVGGQRQGLTLHWQAYNSKFTLRGLYYEAYIRRVTLGSLHLAAYTRRFTAGSLH